MATFVPDAVINAELRETVSRASIRRMIQGGSNILTATSETQRNQRLAEVREAGIELSTTNRIYVHRTDEDSVECFDGSSWRYVVPPPNIMIINGRAYEETGRFNVSINLDIPAGEIYVGNTELQMPYTPPDGYYWQFTGAASGGVGWIARLEGLSSATPTIYGACHYSTTRTFFIGWRLAVY